MSTKLKKQPKKSHGDPVPSRTQMYSGPIPPAAEIARYEQVVPGLADRIVAMAENQGNHRRRVETIQSVQPLLSQIFAFAICMTAIITGYILVKDGYHVSGTIFSGAGLASILAVFVVQRFTTNRK